MIVSRSKITSALTTLAGAVVALQGALQHAPPSVRITIPPIVFLLLGIAVTTCTAINDGLIKLTTDRWVGWAGIASSVFGAISPQVGLIDTRFGFWFMAAGMVFAAIGGPVLKSSGQQVIEAQKLMPKEQVTNAVASFQADNKPMDASKVIQHVTEPTRRITQNNFEG